MNFLVLQKLARSNYAQLLYARAKELNLKFFQNDSDLSVLQINYLYYLEIYHSVYQDLYMKEPNISQAIIEDDLRLEAYLVWKAENRNKPKKPQEKRTIFNSDDSVVFKRK